MAIIHHHHHLLTVLYSFSCLSKTLGILTCRMIFLFGDEEQVGEKRRAKRTGWIGMGWDILCVRGGWERNQTRAELRASAHPADIKRQIKDIKRHALKISCKWAALTTNRSLWDTRSSPSNYKAEVFGFGHNLAQFVQSLFCVLSKGRDHFHKQG